MSDAAVSVTMLLDAGVHWIASELAGGTVTDAAVSTFAASCHGSAEPAARTIASGSVFGAASAAAGVGARSRRREPRKSVGGVAPGIPTGSWSTGGLANGIVAPYWCTAARAPLTALTKSLRTRTVSGIVGCAGPAGRSFVMSTMASGWVLLIQPSG